MKKFVEIEGFIIAIDAIVAIHPGGRDATGKTFIQFGGGDLGRLFDEESVAKLRASLSSDCLRL